MFICIFKYTSRQDDDLMHFRSYKQCLSLRPVDKNIIFVIRSYVQSNLVILVDILSYIIVQEWGLNHYNKGIPYIIDTWNAIAAGWWFHSEHFINMWARICRLSRYDISQFRFAMALGDDVFAPFSPRQINPGMDYTKIRFFVLVPKTSIQHTTVVTSS